MGERNMQTRSLCFYIVCFLSSVSFGNAVLMQNCDSSIKFVPENSGTFDITCDQYSDSIEWQSQTTSSDYVIATCNSTGCQNSNILSGVNALFLNPTSSRLSISKTQRQDSYNYSCRDSLGTVTCQVKVTYPPSKPKIESRNDRGLPYLEGDNIQLLCGLQSWGYPNASFVWTAPQTYSQSGNELTINSATREHDGVNVTCRVYNNFTLDKSVSPAELTDVFSLRVYYRPVISVQSLSENMCSVTSDQCIVTEGERIRLQCQGESNPAPDSYVWKAVNVNSSYSANGSTLDIASANRKTDHGVFRCQVTTSKPDPSDSRLPLSSQKDIAVLVKYQPSEMVFSADSSAGNWVVDENGPVNFNCQAQGRPAPGLRLASRDRELNQTVVGMPSLSDDPSRLTHQILQAQCKDGGEYTCTANNGVGAEAVQSKTLHVKCKPRRVNVDLDPPSVNFTGSPVNLTFDIISYPKPDTNTFTFLGPTQNETNVSKEARQGTFSVDCTMTSAIYAFRCDVTAHEFLSTDETGFYRLRAGNELGRFDYTFYVIVREVSGKAQSSSVVGAAVGGAIAGLVVLVAVGAAIAFFIVRRRRNMDYEQPNHSPKREGSAPYTHLQGQSNPQPTNEGDNSGGQTYANVDTNNSAQVTSPGSDTAYQNTTFPPIPGYQNWRTSTDVHYGNFPVGPTAESESEDNREYANIQIPVDYENTSFSGQNTSSETKKGRQPNPKPKPKPDTKQKPKPNPKPKYLFRHGKRADQNPYSNT